MFSIELQGIGKVFKKETSDVQKTFTEIAEELKKDIYVGGTEIILREGSIEARISLSPKRIFLFKHNEDTRKFTEDYLMSQLNQLKSLVTA